MSAVPSHLIDAVARSLADSLPPAARARAAALYVAAGVLDAPRGPTYSNAVATASALVEIADFVLGPTLVDADTTPERPDPIDRSRLVDVEALRREADALRDAGHRTLSERESLQRRPPDGRHGG